MKYKIAIIIPFYNPRKLIKINLSNILKLSQTYKNVEIIYVDNNSTDNSYEIVKNKIIHKYNFIFDCMSCSKKNVLRGLHFQ
jgi:glycosyltransferase involved in cell wall biosynthesis